MSCITRDVVLPAYNEAESLPNLLDQFCPLAHPIDNRRPRHDRSPWSTLSRSTKRSIHLMHLRGRRLDRELSLNSYSSRSNQFSAKFRRPSDHSNCPRESLRVFGRDQNSLSTILQNLWNSADMAGHNRNPECHSLKEHYRHPFVERR